MGRTPNFKRKRTVPDLIADTRKPKIIADTAWYKIGASEAFEIEFNDPWMNVGGSGNPDAQWYVDNAGESAEAKVIGMVENGDSEGEGSIIFTFPEEVRPRYREVFVCAVEGGGTANIGVYPNGDVVLESYNE